MRTRLKNVGLITVFTLGGLMVVAGAARAAGCCGGGGSPTRAGGYGGGHTYASAAYAAGGSCCAMPGMTMGGMSMPAAQAPVANMQGMQMGANFAPAPAPAASYTCPMHPGVVSPTPATCPYSRMALVRR